MSAQVPSGAPAVAGGRGTREPTGGQQEVLAHAERAEDAPALRDDGESLLGDGVGWAAALRAALEDDVAAPGRREPGHRTDERGLAHAVAAENRDDGPLVDVEAHALQHVGVAVVGVDLAHREERLRHGRSRRRAPRGWSAPRPAGL